MSELLDQRLRAHRLTAPAATITDAARHMLAVQSQDLLAGRWALGVRTKGSATLSMVDAAFANGELVRAWTMRGTLHIIPARDLAWVLSTTASRQRQQAAGRRRDLGIDEAMVAAAARALRPALADGGCTRAEAFERFTSVGIDPTGQRGIHLLFTLTIDGEICQGPVVHSSAITREQRFVAAADWVKDSARPEDPLAELFTRYIEGHGPAGARDFAWWSGLTLSAAREAIERAHRRVREVDDGVFEAPRPPRPALEERTAFALPAFDEYYISYADRTAVCPPEHLAAVGPGRNGMVRATLVESGRVVGTWTHARAMKDAPAELFGGGTGSDAVASAIRRFTDFVGS